MSGLRIAIVTCLAACSGAPPPPAPAPEESRPPARSVEPATPPTIPEIEARLVLADKFRAAGYRILYDVPVAFGSTTVAIDGFDPEKKVGFEYRAAAEAAAWNGDIPATAGARILVIDAADRETVEQRAIAFLAELDPDQP